MYVILWAMCEVVPYNRLTTVEEQIARKSVTALIFDKKNTPSLFCFLGQCGWQGKYCTGAHSFDIHLSDQVVGRENMALLVLDGAQIEQGNPRCLQQGRPHLYTMDEIRALDEEQGQAGVVDCESW